MVAEVDEKIFRGRVGKVGDVKKRKEKKDRDARKEVCLRLWIRATTMNYKEKTKMKKISS